MELTVRRIWPSADAVIGVLDVNGGSQCFTLEAAVRELPGVDVARWKIPGATAIPTGTYRVVIDPSARFGRPMPHILDVPGFDGIRIHPGNTSADTEGCILLGDSRQGDAVLGDSLRAFDAFFPKLQDALARGESCTITVFSQPLPAEKERFFADA